MLSVDSQYSLGISGILNVDNLTSFHTFTQRGGKQQWLKINSNDIEKILTEFIHEELETEELFVNH
jgi:hypothetical protein